jgi:hypothetical protein
MRGEFDEEFRFSLLGEKQYLWDPQLSSQNKSSHKICFPSDSKSKVCEILVDRMYSDSLSSRNREQNEELLLHLNILNTYQLLKHST